MLNEILSTKIEEENIGNIWFQHDGATCHTAAATLDVLRPVAELMSFAHLGAAIWHRCTIVCVMPSKCYGAKPEKIDALKDNIRKAIGEIQLRTIDNAQNWTDRVGITSRGSHLNEIIFYY